MIVGWELVHHQHQFLHLLAQLAVLLQDAWEVIDFLCLVERADEEDHEEALDCLLDEGLLAQLVVEDEVVEGPGQLEKEGLGEGGGEGAFVLVEQLLDDAEQFADVLDVEVLVLETAPIHAHELVGVVVEEGLEHVDQ